MKISASIYAHKSRDYKDVVQELKDLTIDLFHVDCNDDTEVFNDIKILRSISDKLIDVHIISSNPDKFTPLIQEFKPEYVCYQYESIPKDFQLPKIEGVQIGLAVKTPTPISVFDRYKNDCSFILLMATTPGKSGGEFNAKNFRKLRDFKRIYPNHHIHVDGGVNNEVSFILRSYGVNVAVVGSFLLTSSSSGTALLQLKHEYSHSAYLVDDMMVLKEHLPVVQIEHTSVSEILEQNEKYSFGYTLVENKEGKMVGIITNADIRRGLLKTKPNFKDLTVNHLINSSPYFIKTGKTISDLFEYLRSKQATISYLPVLDNENNIKGALHFNFLIKGEL